MILAPIAHMIDSLNHVDSMFLIYKNIYFFYNHVIDQALRLHEETRK